jgi:hypothetical protein
MGDMFEIGPAQLRHMREASAAMVALHPEKYLTGPYALPPRPVKAPAEPVAMPEPEPVLTAADKAKAFLVEALTPDPVPSLELQAWAEAAGVSWRTIRRVAKAAGVKVYRQGRGAWFWSLPPADDRGDDGSLPHASRPLAPR